MTDETLSVAGQGRRLVNFITDLMVVLVVWLFLSVGLMLLGFNKSYVDETGEQVPLTPILIMVPTFWGYYLLMEAVFQRTVGKIITKTKVVSLTGDKPTFAQIALRTLSRSIPFEYLSYLGTAEGIHDRISKTRVIIKLTKRETF